jgi:flagellar basal-body rod protein FlgF
MLRGIYASASGMLADQKRLDVVANNLANVSTTGYKRETTLTQPFSALLLERINDRDSNLAVQPPTVGNLGVGTQFIATATRLTDGAVKATGNPLDVAIVGDGFFAVNTNNGVRYTREGNFSVNAQGTLVTPAGYSVLVDGRPVTATPGTALSIDDTGEVRSGKQVMGRLSIPTSRALGALRKEGNSLWAQAGPADSTILIPQAESTGQFQLRVGYLESSNVEAVTEMVDMITLMRSFEANQKALQAQDETLQKAVSEVGRL